MPSEPAEPAAHADRLPPNQSLVAPGRWPIVGERESDPGRAGEPWTLTLDGSVRAPRTWSLEELEAIGGEEFTLDIHCVTRWSRLDARFRGVTLRALLDAVGGPADGAGFVRFAARSARGHDTTLPLADALELGGTGVLIVTHADGEPLEPIHGGPVRSVTPGRYFYKSIKWLERIELLTEDRLGWWEANAGYHHRAEPWAEERYLAPDLDRRTVARVMESRDMSGLDLRSISAEGRELSGLVAVDAALRDADFRRANLQRADFSRANLSNARLGGADLRGATFAHADLEGADFRGADLRGADLRVLSLFGASFGPEPGERGEPARFDDQTTWDPTKVDALTPAQRRWVDAAIGG